MDTTGGCIFCGRLCQKFTLMVISWTIFYSSVYVTDYVQTYRISISLKKRLKKCTELSIIFIKHQTHLGLLQARCLNITPPAHDLVHVVQGDQPDQTPSTGRGPSSPYSTHMPFRHHCVNETGSFSVIRMLRRAHGKSILFETATNYFTCDLCLHIFFGAFEEMLFADFLNNSHIS